MKMRTKMLTATAMGIALFAALSLCLQVPVFENYYLCLGYVVMAVCCYCFGAVSGCLAGSLGVVLLCVINNGLRGMPGWALGNLVIGAVLGLTFGKTKRLSNRPVALCLNALAVVLSVAIGILGVKSLTECILYTQPFFVRAAKNTAAAIADVFMLLVSLPICMFLDPVIERIFSEERRKT